MELHVLGRGAMAELAIHLHPGHETAVPDALHLVEFGTDLQGTLLRAGRLLLAGLAVFEQSSVLGIDEHGRLNRHLLQFFNCPFREFLHLRFVLLLLPFSPG